jgi:hypothetical protein
MMTSMAMPDDWFALDGDIARDDHLMRLDDAPHLSMCRLPGAGGERLHQDPDIDHIRISHMLQKSITNHVSTSSARGLSQKHSQASTGLFLSSPRRRGSS